MDTAEQTDLILHQPGPISDQISVTNPITGEEVGRVARSRPSDILASIERARRAQPAWGAYPFRERARIFKRFHDLILDRREELFDVIQAESGKSRRDAFVELFAIAAESRYYAYNGERFLRPRFARTAIPVRDMTRVYHHPAGVVGVISAWNFPLILSIGDTIPALLAGNEVVLKPSEITPLTAEWGRARLIEAGLPEDVFQIVHGFGPDVGPSLIPNVNYLHFTGSERAGRHIARQAAAHMVPFCLELGGKNAMIVLDNADVKHAATVAIEGAFNNAGQVCITFERLYVHEKVYDRFVAELLRQTSALRLGAGRRFDYDIGSLVSTAHADKIEQHVQDAISKGVTVLAGGKRRPDIGPAYFEPTILEGATSEMLLFAEETFGPVISLYRFSSVEDAIRLANDTPYGLHYIVYSSDLREGQRVARRLHAGTVGVNDSYTVWGAIDAPLGGMKNSGIGRRHGPEGILRFTQTQSVTTNLTRLQVGSYETALSINQRLADALTWALRLWRHIPFIR
ncbi:MAG: succinate-semialdehyde dehydrogenase (NADP(+)) [Anaerolineae bacterium]|nr:succinate-semialdehyde dehydrogenase (NADP(+)) [Anaerolineae bacterium]